MTRHSLAATVVFALIAAAGPGFAQQQPESGGEPPPTCGGMASNCTSGCATGPGHARCIAGCETTRAECMATGMWKSAAGKLIPKRKE